MARAASGTRSACKLEWYLSRVWQIRIARLFAGAPYWQSRVGSVEILTLDRQPDAIATVAVPCDDCNPIAVTLSKLDRTVLAYAVGAVCFLMLAGSLRAAGPAWQLAALIPSPPLVWWTFRQVKVVRPKAMPFPPLSGESRHTPDLFLRYIEMSDKALFGWATLVALAHSGAAAVLAPLVVSKTSTADLTLVGGGMALLGFLCYASVHATEAAWARAQHAIHWARHNGSLAPFVQYVHAGNDGRKSHEIVQSLLGQAAFVWVYVGSCLMSIGFLLWVVAPQ